MRLLMYSSAQMNTDIVSKDLTWTTSMGHSDEHSAWLKHGSKCNHKAENVLSVLATHV